MYPGISKGRKYFEHLAKKHAGDLDPGYIKFAEKVFGEYLLLTLPNKKRFPADRLDVEGLFEGTNLFEEAGLICLSHHDIVTESGVVIPFAYNPFSSSGFSNSSVFNYVKWKDPDLLRNMMKQELERVEGNFNGTAKEILREKYYLDGIFYLDGDEESILAGIKREMRKNLKAIRKSLKLKPEKMRYKNALSFLPLNAVWKSPKVSMLGAGADLLGIRQSGNVKAIRDDYRLVDADKIDVIINNAVSNK